MVSIDAAKQISKRVLISGGTGSLGGSLVPYLLETFPYWKLRIFSRDEERQYLRKMSLSKEYIDRVDFVIGDIRNKQSVFDALEGIDIVFNAAALKQVPTCEIQPSEAIMTNCIGAQNIVDCISMGRQVKTVVGISTDKACAPSTVMGNTKALQEKIFIAAGKNISTTEFKLARYGNVLNSRGSILPLFKQQGESNQPITITHRDMTRFLMTLQDSVNTIINACFNAPNLSTTIPIIKSAKIIDVAKLYSEKYNVPLIETGVRPGEKMHEVLVSNDESLKTTNDDKYIYIGQQIVNSEFLEYSSKDNLMTKEELFSLLSYNNLI
jgi:UDP-glucose 4-epimerase